MKVRTYLVDDNPIIRGNLISTLEELGSVETVGVANNQEEGAAWLTQNGRHWDLAIVDLFLKSGSGLGVMNACRGRSTLQKMVLFSDYATREMRCRCAELGVDAVFDNSTEIDELVAYCVCQSQILTSAADRATGHEVSPKISFLIQPNGEGK